MTQTPIYDAVVEAEGYTPGEVQIMDHQEFIAHSARVRRQARKAAVGLANRPHPAKKAPAKKAPAKKATAKKTQPKKG